MEVVYCGGQSSGKSTCTLLQVSKFLVHSKVYSPEIEIPFSKNKFSFLISRISKVLHNKRVIKDIIFYEQALKRLNSKLLAMKDPYWKGHLEYYGRK